MTTTVLSNIVVLSPLMFVLLAGKTKQILITNRMKRQLMLNKAISVLFLNNRCDDFVHRNSLYIIIIITIITHSILPTYVLVYTFNIFL